MDEQKNEIEKKSNIAEIAKKKRHLYLYDKLHSGTLFTPVKLCEIENFEEVDSAIGVVNTKEKVAKALKVSGEDGLLLGKGRDAFDAER